MIEPLDGIVLVKIQNEDFKTSDSGIILKRNNGAVSDRNITGIIEAVSKNSSLKPGYTVYFDKTSGIDYSENDQDYLFLKESSLLGYSI
jgi:chaperonin 10 Kd subunit